MKKFTVILEGNEGNETVSVIAASVEVNDCYLIFVDADWKVVASFKHWLAVSREGSTERPVKAKPTKVPN